MAQILSILNSLPLTERNPRATQPFFGLERRLNDSGVSRGRFLYGIAILESPLLHSFVRSLCVLQQQSKSGTYAKLLQDPLVEYECRLGFSRRQIRPNGRASSDNSRTLLSIEVKLDHPEKLFLLFCQHVYSIQRFSLLSPPFYVRVPV